MEANPSKKLTVPTISGFTMGHPQLATRTRAAPRRCYVEAALRSRRLDRCRIGNQVRVSIGFVRACVRAYGRACVQQTYNQMSHICRLKM